MMSRYQVPICRDAGGVTVGGRIPALPGAFVTDTE